MVGPSDEKVQWRNWRGCVMEPLTAVRLRKPWEASEGLGSPKDSEGPWVALRSPGESWEGLWVHSLEAREPWRGGPLVQTLEAKNRQVKGFF